jgi:hypothetical protein
MSRPSVSVFDFLSPQLKTFTEQGYLEEATKSKADPERLCRIKAETCLILLM